MKSIRTKNIISITLNIVMAVFVCSAVGYFFTENGMKSGIGNMTSGGSYCFKYFTIDSNILGALCGLLTVPFNIKSIINGKNEIPEWATVLKFIGTVAVTVTFITVIVFLGPIIGYAPMFEGNCFTLHLVCPLISIISFCFLEKGTDVSKKQTLFGVLPVVIYGTVYLINVIFTKKWADFYHFNIGGFWYISFVVMLTATYIIALVLRVAHNKKGEPI